MGDIPFEIMKFNRDWFKIHGHLTDQEMLELGLIDECDLEWVNKLRDAEWLNH